jgi:arginase family enzyme
MDRLRALLRPAAGGLYLVSTGKAEQLAIQRAIYGAADEREVNEKWVDALSRLKSAKVAILGIPSDVGAGFLRGANMGPQALRSELLRQDPTFFATMEARGVIDAGDVFVVPQLLHDDMLSDAQKAASRRALYPELAAAEAATLPVSPLSMLEAALDAIFAINPDIVPLVLGGDHSCAWPVTAALARRRPGLGIVQMDAHTDLLEERLGVRYCFATWSYHASRVLDAPDKMVQVGLRASRHPREHWEKTVGVRQFWAAECNGDPEGAITRIVEHLTARGVREIYFSNDIDGTDEAFADATGTPETGGLHPDFVVSLIRRLGERFRVCAGDIMEVAPPLERLPGGRARTLEVSARYVRETLEAILSNNPHLQ